MYPRNFQLTTLEEDFRAIGLLPQKQLSEVDNSAEPRDIPSPDPSTDTGSDMQAMPARNKYAKQPKPKMTPTETDDHDEPEDAGGTQGGKKGGSYKPVAGGKEASLRREDAEYPSSYKELKNAIMKRATPAANQGKAPAVAQGLAPTDKIAGMSKKHEGRNLSRAAELVGEVEALLAGSQMSEDYNNLAHGFALISENCSLLADRLVDIAEHYNVDHAIKAMEELYNNAIEASQIIEMKSKKKDDKDDDDDDDDDDADEALESIKEAFRLMTLQLMDAVESYDATITEMSKDDDDDDDKDDDDDDDDKDDDKDDDDDKGGIAARMAKLKAGKGKGPFGK